MIPPTGDAVSPSATMLAVDSPVMVRLARAYDHEFAARIEGFLADAVVVSAPPGANSALLASGSRHIELSWLSPRGRYEQTCRLELDPGAKHWLLRPLRKAVLIQRRRYIRVRASIGVSVARRGDRVPGSTVDVSEGGFRIRIPRQGVRDLEHVIVHAVIGGRKTALPGYVVRTTDVDPDETEAVIAFEADGAAVAAVRKFVLHMQLRERATRGC